MAHHRRHRKDALDCMLETVEVCTAILVGGLSILAALTVLGAAVFWLYRLVRVVL